MPTSEQWLKVRAHMRRHRHALATKAAAEYPDVPKVADTPLLTNPRWVPDAPVPLTEIELERRTNGEFHGLRGTEDVAYVALPATAGVDRHRSYATAMADLDAPSAFQDRSTYRLLDADIAARRFVFGSGTYFDGIDVGEACAHEYAARELGLIDQLRLRSAVGNPCDPARRPSNIAISNLTIRLDRTTGDGTFYLHWRDPKKVGHAGGMYQVLPVGIFQPSSDESWNLDNDFSLWRCLVREFAEELLGVSEEHGSAEAPIDYGGWPFAVRLTGALGNEVRVSYLGMGVDPLTFATDMLTVSVIDAPLFDELFDNIVADNEEGRVLEGLPFTAANVERFIHGEPTQAAGAALLALAWQHRDALLP